MSHPVVVAMIAAAVALSVAYINTFVSEGYKRFRDGTALAASLSDELAAYEEAWPLLSKVLDSLVTASETGTPDLSSLRPIERPKDLVYEKSIEKLGLLGAQAAESIVYVYSNINAFRLAFEMIARDHEKMSRNELQLRAIACRDALNRAAIKGSVLVGVLRERASAQFKPEWPWSHWLR